jgi:hypothetical protein
VRRHLHLLFMTALLIGCGSAGPAAIDPVASIPSLNVASPRVLGFDGPNPSAPTSTHPGTLASDGIPSVSPTPTETPLPAPPPPTPMHLDWTQGTFPADFGCPGGCSWGLVPVFGGLALTYGTDDPKDEVMRWGWTGDGQHWRALKGLPQDTEWLEPDGTPNGAFAFTESYVDGERQTALWRTIDGGVTWQWVTDTTAWEPFGYGTFGYERSNGHNLMVTAGKRSNGHDLMVSAGKAFASDDGWSWQAAPLPNLAPLEGVRIDGTETGFIAQWRTTAGSMFSTSGDGRAWTAPLPYPSEARLVYRVPWGFVAFEMEGGTPSDPFSTDQVGLVAVWTSNDGRSWTRRQTIGQSSRWDDLMEFTAELHAVPGGFVLYQFSQHDLVLFSRDGVTWVKVNVPKNCGLAAGPGDGDTVRWGSLVCLAYGKWEFWQTQMPSP